MSETKIGMRLLTDTLNNGFFCSKIYIICFVKPFYQLVKTDKRLSRNCHMYKSVTGATRFGSNIFMPCVISLTLGIHL